MSSEQLPPAATGVPAGGATEKKTGADVDGRNPRYGLVGRLVAEGVGSFLLVFIGIGISFFNSTGISSALGFGLGLAAAMVAFGYVSGGHFNPVLTVGSALAGRTRWGSVLPYVVVQVLGAVLAAGILLITITGHPQITDTQQAFSLASNGYGEHSSAEFPLASALLTEVVSAALLTAVFLGATKRRRGAAGAAFAVGLTYAALLTFLGPITGGSINPARSTAPVFFAESWAVQQLWLFWAAPLLGAVITGLIFRSIDMSENPTPSSADRTDEDDAAPETEADASSVAAAPESDSPAAPATAAGTQAAPSAAGGATAADRSVDDEARGFFDGNGAPDNIKGNGPEKGTGRQS